MSIGVTASYKCLMLLTLELILFLEETVGLRILGTEEGDFSISGSVSLPLSLYRGTDP